jgi:hypothetical protein
LPSARKKNARQSLRCSAKKRIPVVFAGAHDLRRRQPGHHSPWHQGLVYPRPTSRPTAPLLFCWPRILVELWLPNWHFATLCKIGQKQGHQSEPPFCLFQEGIWMTKILVFIPLA